jgi:hypothetical protein
MNELRLLVTEFKAFAVYHAKQAAKTDPKGLRLSPRHGAAAMAYAECAELLECRLVDAYIKPATR